MIDLTYPYTPSNRKQEVLSPIGGQVLANLPENQIPLQNANYTTHDNTRVIITPVTYQDSRRAGDADKEIVAVGQPGYLFQRLYDSPALTGKAEE